ncbi:MAG: DUF1722 domain-containing protein [Nitrospinaceae bacterium]|nr:DUF523 and DUF1722 domain-containing protein [Nitrospinaceae bacterium]NIR56616.1 DUF523 and DUF1722 domain-containing protein [Nitrospinaceae bacterium]NIS87079.1 DUF523 and DUF1722 domain-containing protein [Nitrospinaceae bacterium]NIT83933.1 DUF523 and DUF1722 domain-containing protein [Nitrospinaceae bacterium]NIU46124.1 DUF523 and DUF1722 domain-containing protein [Nitrospinaceae bacterium]
MSTERREPKIRVGVSSCLLGERVRWNGDHKQDLYVKGLLGQYFEWVPTCPEVEIGMGIPRETVQLQGGAHQPRMVGTRSGQDWTAPMNRYSRQRAKELANLNLCGYIFKNRSPSCGIARIKVYGSDGRATPNGRGLFAGAVMEHVPWIPIEDEGRLRDARIRENFITRVFACHRLLQLLHGRFTRKALVEFHTAHKFLLMAHSRKHYDALGRLVAQAKQMTPLDLKNRYAEEFMRALSYKSTPKKNTDVLYHMLGFFKKQLSAVEKQDVIEAIEDYRSGLVPLIVPVTLIRHHVRKHRVEYLNDQIYLNPHPKELMLRNHV